MLRDHNGTCMLKLKDCVIGLGFVDKKNSVEYIRWARVRDYLRQINFSPDVAKMNSDADIFTLTDKELRELFIPEPYFYLLAMKADSSEARVFQHKVAFEILPAIRKHGAYMTPEVIEKAILTPDFVIKLATQLKLEQERSAALELKVEEMAPKSAYCDAILQAPGLVTVTAISKDYGISAVNFNKLLHKLRIQFKQGKLWVLYQEYADKGYTQTKTFINEGVTQLHTYWTQTGRLFLYETLKKVGYLPMIEQTAKSIMALTDEQFDEMTSEGQKALLETATEVL